jgi:hypothetical protein
LKQRRIVNYYRQKEDPDGFKKEKEEDESMIRSLHPPTTVWELNEWTGKSKDRMNVYEGGSMYWTGTMHTLVTLPEGEATVNIMASGSSANGLFPYMSVELDGNEIGGVFIDSSDWKDYSFKVKTDGGVKVLSVTFANDGSNKEKGEDRNLYVREVRISENE